MLKNLLLIIAFLSPIREAFSQVVRTDTIPDVRNEALNIDTSFDYDELLNELEMFLDSLLLPRSNFVASISMGKGYFNYSKASGQQLKTRDGLVYSPTIGYYHRTGPGLTLSGNVTDDGEKFNFYQLAITPSFDFIQNVNWIGGISYTRYFAKKSLPFYLSPLQNEVNAYFTWRKPWLQPGVTASYGWGSRTEYQKRERFIRLLLLRRGIAYVARSEEIADLSLSASVRHSFYWMNVGSQRNYLKLTPQLLFAAGSQRFGFNRATSSSVANVRRESSLMYNRGDISIDEKFKFQPLSASLYLRPEYNIGKIFIQPQFILDYYFPADDLAALFSINAGIIL